MKSGKSSAERRQIKARKATAAGGGERERTEMNNEPRGRPNRKEGRIKTISVGDDSMQGRSVEKKRLFEKLPPYDHTISY